METRYYKDFTDDFIETKRQDHRIPADYKWIHDNVLYRLGANTLFFIAKIYADIYLSVYMGVKVCDSTSAATHEKKGCFLYGNHTLPQGDVFAPLKCKPHHRIYTVVDAANLGIPILGRLLPMLGAIPIPSSLHQMAKFKDAVIERVNEGWCVVIYPEAHVWPYYTGIRPFEHGAFLYPADMGAACFCSTVTYKKHQWRKKPAITIWVDGPFYPDMSLNKKKRQAKLGREIYECMCERSKESTYEYIRYEEMKK